jgi:hypothetical protein
LDSEAASDSVRKRRDGTGGGCVGQEHLAADSRQSPREPEEIARGVVFLITDDADFISMV